MNAKIKILMAICSIMLCINVLVMGQTDTINLTALTFEQAATYMSLNSYTIKKSDNLIHQKEHELKAARGLFMPKVSVSANAVALSEDITLDLNPVKDAITPLYSTLGNYGVFSSASIPDPSTSGLVPVLGDNFTTLVVRSALLEGLDQIEAADWNSIIQKKNFATVNASFTMPIYTGGKIMAANRAAKIEVDEANTDKILKEGELFCELVERYYMLVLSNHVKEVRSEVRNTMNGHLLDAEKMKKQGMIADAEYLHAKVYFSEAEREYNKAMREHLIINDAFLSTLSVDSIISVMPISQLFYLSQMEPLEYFVASGMEQNDILKMVNHKMELAHEGYKVEQANYLPTVAALGNYQIVNKDLSPYIPQYMVGVGLNWSVFDGTSRMRKTQAAKFREEQASDYYDQTELNIKVAIQKYYQEMQLQLEQLTELETAFEFANEYTRIREKAFNEGMATTSEVSDANLALAKVKIDRLKAVYQYDVALVKLLFYSGRISEFAEYKNNSNTIYCKF